MSDYALGMSILGLETSADEALTIILELANGKNSQSYSTFEHIGLLKC